MPGQFCHASGKVAPSALLAAISDIPRMRPASTRVPPTPALRRRSRPHDGSCGHMRSPTWLRRVRRQLSFPVMSLPSTTVDHQRPILNHKTSSWSVRPQSHATEHRRCSHRIIARDTRNGRSACPEFPDHTQAPESPVAISRAVRHLHAKSPRLPRRGNEHPTGSSLTAAVSPSTTASSDRKRVRMERPATPAGQPAHA